MERKNGLPPVHPGEILKEDVLPSVGLFGDGRSEISGSFAPDAS